MQISFFEEFSTKSNLERIKLVNWPTKLYLAAPSLAEFQKIKSKIKSKKVKEFIYWPILKKKEGYWISPFSQRKALKRVFQELGDKKIPVMLDLELPTTQNLFLYLTQLTHFKINKKLIKDFINQYRGEIYLAEYYPEGKKAEKRLQRLGLDYHTKKVKIIKMLYHSMHNFSYDFLEEELKEGKKEYKNNFLVAYGTIAPGKKRNEPLLSKKMLEKDLKLAKKTGIKEVVIFRLGGLNTKYLKVIKNI